MNKNLPRALSHIVAVQAYKPGKPIETLARESGLAVTDIIKLASNESPLGPSPEVLKTVTQSLFNISRYPDGASFALLQTLAETILAGSTNADTNCLTVANGSNEILDLIARTFLKPGDCAWFDQHSFAIYPIVTQLAGAKGVMIPAKNYGHDMPAYLQKLQNEPAPTMIFLANPNNPTGTWFNRQTLCTLLDSLPSNTLVVLDEAYCEYVQATDYPNGLNLLNHYPNLLVTRTFSKAYGLAGLRLGYAVAHPQITQALQRVRQPFNVNLLAQLAGIAALRDQPHLQKAVSLNRDELALMVQECQRRDLTFIPSQANFLSIDCGQAAQPIYEALLQKGIIVRPIVDYGLPNHLRVSIGLPEENRLFWQKWDLLMKDKRKNA